MNKSTVALTSCLAVCALSGCASSGSSGTAVVQNDTASQEVIAQQQSTISQLERELEAARRDAQMAAKTPTSPVIPEGMSSDLFPPNAEPGRCYARVLIPATYREESERVLVKEASERVEIIPAQYETVTERVLVKEASTRLETIPARYETVEERVLVKAASSRIEEVPATYKTMSERVLVSPARTEWKRGPASSFNGVLSTSTTDTGEIMCLVEVPAVYKTVSRTVVDQPATTREVVIPAEYRTIKKTVLAEPARTREITIPAEYDTVKVQNVVKPAAERRIKIPEEYSTVTRQVKVGEDELEWRGVLCEVNMTPTNVRLLQTKLNAAGYKAGNEDGMLGAQTLQAANSYARANGLPYGQNYIALEVAEKLGLRL
ncbi:MAG: peptidoglycan-binding domain-containing protein [Pseudomonadota bacterium]